jgi:organic radical activating enzyme|tara:strand:- start:3329 stop:4009 length:681 start_codon:yes stop_codon:yes gene_type:complete
MKISEIFKSIQGEGTNAGKPSIFLRTAECNLKCTWCDTKYTWDWKNFDYSKEVKEISIKEIREIIERFHLRHLVITGGEPLMQQDDLAELLVFLKPEFYVEIETNGTILPNNALSALVDQWNVSPKTKNSGNPLEMCEDNECYAFFSKQKNCYFKYVVENKDDLMEIHHLMKKHRLEKNRVLLMTQAITKEEMLEREAGVFLMSKEHDLGFSPRMHVTKWGNQRGK